MIPTPPKNSMSISPPPASSAPDMPRVFAQRRDEQGGRADPQRDEEHDRQRHDDADEVDAAKQKARGDERRHPGEQRGELDPLRQQLADDHLACRERRHA